MSTVGTTVARAADEAKTATDSEATAGASVTTITDEGKAAGEGTFAAPVLAMRTGLGIDVHAFAPIEEGRPLILGGVTIPHDRGLAGHSDADVLAHAMSDALLGAARLGDIGKLFPDTDPAYKNADSIKLLAHVAQAVRDAGFMVVDVDSVICAQAPKLSPFRDKMRQNLASAIGIDVSNVGCKATTTERLGFEGREEGISAYATCLLQRSAD